MGEASAEQLIKLLDRGADRSRAPLLWVGAGLSIPAGYPSLKQLAEQLRAASLAALPEGLCAAETIDAFVEHNGRSDLAETLADMIDRKQPLQFHKALMKLPWKAVITTNYDELLEDALKAVARPFLKVTLGDIGNAYSDLGQVAKAIDYYEQALVIQREIGDRRGEGNQLGNLGIVYGALGQVENAKQYLKSALAIGQEIRDPNIVGIVSEALKKMDDIKVE